MTEIDQTALNNIRALQRPGKPDLLGRIVTLFLNQTPDAITTILNALTAGDLDTVRTSAHSMKTSAAYVGATQFSIRMSDIESAAREGQLSRCQELTLDLQEHAAQVACELIPMQDLAA